VGTRHSEIKVASEDAESLLKGVLPPNLTNRDHPHNYSQAKPAASRNRHGNREQQKAQMKGIAFVPSSGNQPPAKTRSFSEAAPPPRVKKMIEETKPERTIQMDGGGGQWAWSTGR
jgi:hypothetical protein